MDVGAPPLGTIRLAEMQGHICNLRYASLRRIYDKKI
jgi:hypothetical protein